VLQTFYRNWYSWSRFTRI